MDFDRSKSKNEGKVFLNGKNILMRRNDHNGIDLNKDVVTQSVNNSTELQKLNTPQ